MTVYQKIRKPLLYYFSILLVLLVTAAVLSNKWYFEKASSAEAKKKNLEQISANAIKHAYAASLFHGALQDLWMGRRISRGVVIFFGEVNEVAELVFRSKKDSTLEIMKDLHNNMVGVCVSEWLKDNNIQNNRLTVMGDFAKKGLLMSSRENINLKDEEKELARKTSNFWIAKKWFEKNKWDIIRKVRRELAGEDVEEKAQDLI